MSHNTPPQFAYDMLVENIKNRAFSHARSTHILDSRWVADPCTTPIRQHHYHKGHQNHSQLSDRQSTSLVATPSSARRCNGPRVRLATGAVPVPADLQPASHMERICDVCDTSNPTWFEICRSCRSDIFNVVPAEEAAAASTTRMSFTRSSRDVSAVNRT